MADSARPVPVELRLKRNRATAFVISFLVFVFDQATKWVVTYPLNLAGQPDLEIKITSFGLLTLGGLVSLILGSMMLIDTTVPELRVSLRLIVPIALAFTAIAALLVRLAVRAQRQRPVTGAGGMVGEYGQTLTAIDPERGGTVLTHGEIWRATAEQAIPQGSRVRVTAVEGDAAGSRLIVQGPRGEVLIPLVEGICVAVDVQGKKIVVEPPEGLLDLNVTKRQRF